MSLWVSAVVVLAYITLGGLTSAIYNEVLQFFLIVLGFAPLVFLGLHDVGGWDGLKQKLNLVAANAPDQGHYPPALVTDTIPGESIAGKQNPPGKSDYPAGAWTNAWANMATPASNPMHVEWFGMVLGLGFVLAFGYWCTDFLVVQRHGGRIDVGGPPRSGHCHDPQDPHSGDRDRTGHDRPGRQAAAGRVPYNGGLLEHRGEGYDGGAFCRAYPTKAERGQGPGDRKDVDGGQARREGKRGIGLRYGHSHDAHPVFSHRTAGAWTDGVDGLVHVGHGRKRDGFQHGLDVRHYQSYIAPNRSDTHYLWMGRMATIFGVVVSIAAAYVAAQFNNIMDFIQLVFGFVNAPLFATFLLGMFWKRTTGHGAFFGLVCGTAASAVHPAITIPKGGWLTAALRLQPVNAYGSDMAQNFWMAIYAWTTCFVMTIVISLATRPNKTEDECADSYGRSLRERARDHLAWYAKPITLGLIMLAVTVVLNYIFW